MIDTTGKPLEQEPQIDPFQHPEWRQGANGNYMHFNFAVLPDDTVYLCTVPEFDGRKFPDTLGIRVKKEVDEVGAALCLIIHKGMTFYCLSHGIPPREDHERGEARLQAFFDAVMLSCFEEDYRVYMEQERGKYGPA